jgi:hypothetical protein
MTLRSFYTGALALTLAAPGAFADFSYDQTSKITGGAMQGMMKFAGAFNKQLREPMVTTVAVKGNRMANISKESINLIDLDAQTITDINLKDRTFSTITFAEMTAAMQKAMERVNKDMAAQGADAKWNINVKDTGESQTVNGLPAKRFVIDVEMAATDQKSGQSGAMNTSMDMWMTPSIRGYDEVKRFYEAMAEKMAFTPGGMGMAMGRADMAKGMAQAYKEAAKMDGIPVMQVIRMGPKLTPEQQAELAKAQQEQANQPPPPTASEAAGNAAGNAAAGAALGRLGKAGAIGGALGGFGGFGRKKKEQPQEQAQAPAQQQAPAQTASASSAGSLMEMTIESSNFSSAPVDASKFAVPAGFKEVEHSMKKMLK